MRCLLDFSVTLHCLATFVSLAMPHVSYIVRLVGVQYLEDNTEAHYTLNTIQCIVYSNTTEQQQGVSS